MRNPWALPTPPRPTPPHWFPGETRQMEASDWTYTQIPSRIEQVGLRVQLQLTVEQFDLFVGLGDVVFDKLFHVCSNGDARETAARSRSHVFSTFAECTRCLSDYRNVDIILCWAVKC